MECKFAILSGIHHISQFYSKMGIEPGDAVLMMNSCSSDIIDDMMDLIPAAKMLFLTLAQRTTELLQLFDPIFFLIFKREEKLHPPFGKVVMNARFGYHE
jgi:hypothetical protein